MLRQRSATSKSPVCQLRTLAIRRMTGHSNEHNGVGGGPPATESTALNAPLQIGRVARISFERRVLTPTRRYERHNDPTQRIRVA
jgi:hypothetical protein